MLIIFYALSWGLKSMRMFRITEFWCEEERILKNVYFYCPVRNEQVIVLIKLGQVRKDETMSRTNWTQQEDELLCRLAEEFQAKEWSEIEKKFNSVFCNRERTCKQLRQRFKNYLQYERGNALVKQWSREEEKLLFQEYLDKGSKWTQISKILPGKSEAYIKNKFYGGLRKALRRINQVRKNQMVKFSKPIKYSSLIRVLQIKEKSSTLPEELKEQALALRERIVVFSQRNLSNDDSEDVMEFCEELFKFNFSSRCYRVRKPSLKKILSEEQNEIKESNGQDQEQSNELSFKEDEGKVDIENDPVAKFFNLSHSGQKLPLALPRKISNHISNDAKSITNDDQYTEKSVLSEPLFKCSAFSLVSQPKFSSSNPVPWAVQLGELRGKPIATTYLIPPILEDYEQQTIKMKKTQSL